MSRVSFMVCQPKQSETKSHLILDQYFSNSNYMLYDIQV
jgi:hypothetical protein